MRPVLAELERRDANLAQQMRRALQSTAPSTAEGMYSRKGNRPVRYHAALAEAHEARACLEVAVAMGTLPVLDEALMARFDRIGAVLHRLAVG
jgi:four helix bundle protein